MPVCSFLTFPPSRLPGLRLFPARPHIPSLHPSLFASYLEAKEGRQHRGHPRRPRRKQHQPSNELVRDNDLYFSRSRSRSLSLSVSLSLPLRPSLSLSLSFRSLFLSPLLILLLSLIPLLYGPIRIALRIKHTQCEHPPPRLISAVIGQSALHGAASTRLSGACACAFAICHRLPPRCNDAAHGRAAHGTQRPPGPGGTLSLAPTARLGPASATVPAHLAPPPGFPPAIPARHSRQQPRGALTRRRASGRSTSMSPLPTRLVMATLSISCERRGGGGCSEGIRLLALSGNPARSSPFLPLQPGSEGFPYQGQLIGSGRSGAGLWGKIKSGIKATADAHPLRRHAGDESARTRASDARQQSHAQTHQVDMRKRKWKCEKEGERGGDVEMG